MKSWKESSRECPSEDLRSALAHHPVPRGSVHAYGPPVILSPPAIAGSRRWHYGTPLQGRIGVGLQLVRAIEESESRDFQVEGSEELRSAFRTVNALSHKFKSRIVALDAFIDGNGIPADQFLNDL